MPASAIVTGLGGLSTLLVHLPAASARPAAAAQVGAFLGLIAVAAITYGGWRAMQEEGATFGDAGDRSPAVAEAPAPERLPPHRLLAAPASRRLRPRRRLRAAAPSASRRPGGRVRGPLGRRRPARLALERVGRLSRGEMIAGEPAVLLVRVDVPALVRSRGGRAAGLTAVGYTLNVPEITGNAWQDLLASSTSSCCWPRLVGACRGALLPPGGRRAGLGRNMCRAAAGFGSLSVLLVLFRLIDPPGGGSLRAGVFIGLLAAGAVSVGAFFLLQERGVLLSDGSVPGRRERRKESSRPRPKRAGA